jgi:hypothetical protein
MGRRKGRPLPMVDGFDSPSVLWLLAAAQLCGLSSAWLARLSEGSRCQALSQLAFFVVLPLMGATTAISLAAGSGFWIICAITLTVMVLTVTCDFRRGREAATW